MRDRERNRGRGKETEEEEGSRWLQRRGGKADCRVHASNIWESRGGRRESRGDERHTRRKGKYPTKARQSRCGRMCGLEAEAESRCAKQGRPAGGLEQRSSQAELEVSPPPSLFLFRSPGLPTAFLFSSPLDLSRGRG